MAIPTEVSFRRMDKSEAVQTRILERVEALERLHDRIMRCVIVVDTPHRHKHKGPLFDVKIHIHIPGGEILISREGPQNHAHEDVYVAVRDAFDAAERKLQDRVRRRDHRTRPHEGPTHGKDTPHFGAEGYGFLETSDGLEVYFHQNSVVDGAFGNLQIGDEVRIEIASDESEHGPQATTVHPIGKHHLSP